jgi:hypothetical protein
MASATEAIAAVRRGGGQDGGFVYPRVNQYDEFLVQSSGLPYTEWSRRGWGWQVMDTTATAAVVVRPSTVAGLTLYNGGTTKNMIIDRVGAFNLVSTDAIADWSVWGCVHPTGFTAPTADITAIKGYHGAQGAYGGGAIVDTGATVADGGWFILDSVGSKVGNPGGVTPGTAISIDTEGRFIIPPTAAFSINVVASLVTWTFTHMISWFEVPIQAVES